MDLIVFLAKFNIYNCRSQECLPLMDPFKNILKFRYNTEKYSACAIGNLTTFSLQWLPYVHLVILNEPPVELLICLWMY